MLHKIGVSQRRTGDVQTLDVAGAIQLALGGRLDVDCDRWRGAGFVCQAGSKCAHARQDQHRSKPRRQAASVLVRFETQLCGGRPRSRAACSPSGVQGACGEISQIGC